MFHAVSICILVNWPTYSHVVIKSSSKKQQHWLYRKLTLDCLSWAIILLLKSLYSKISNSNITKNSLLYVFQKSKYSRWPGKTTTNSPRLLQLWCEPETGCMMHNQKKNCGTRNCTSAYQVLALYEKNCCIYMMYLLDTIQISRIPYDSTQNDCRLVPCGTSLPPSSSKWEGEMDIFVGPRSALLGIVCPKKAADKIAHVQSMRRYLWCVCGDGCEILPEDSTSI